MNPNPPQTAQAQDLILRTIRVMWLNRARKAGDCHQMKKTFIKAACVACGAFDVDYFPIKMRNFFRRIAYGVFQRIGFNQAGDVGLIFHSRNFVTIGVTTAPEADLVNLHS